MSGRAAPKHSYPDASGSPWGARLGDRDGGGKFGRVADDSPAVRACLARACSSPGSTREERNRDLLDLPAVVEELGPRAGAKSRGRRRQGDRSPQRLWTAAQREPASLLNEEGKT